MNFILKKGDFSKITGCRLKTGKQFLAFSPERTGALEDYGLTAAPIGRLNPMKKAFL